MIAKKGDAGRSKFVNLLNEMRSARRPELEKMWSRLPLAYRRMVYERAAVPECKLSESLFSLTEGQRKRLMQANNDIAAMAAEAAKVLGSAVRATP